MIEFIMGIICGKLLFCDNNSKELKGTIINYPFETIMRFTPEQN